MKTIQFIQNQIEAATFKALLDGGRFFTVNELAYMTGENRQSIQSILNRDFISVKKSGGHLYYAIENQIIRQEIESYLAMQPHINIKPLKKQKDESLLYARTCYHHLAGTLGVQLANAMLRLGYLKEEHDEFIITNKGLEFFRSFQADIGKETSSPKCLDFSERRPHLAGTLGKALLNRLLDLKWIERIPDARAINITSAGKKGLHDTFGITSV